MSPARRARLRWPRFPFPLIAGLLAACAMSAADPVSPDGVTGMAVTGASGSALYLVAMLMLGAVCRDDAPGAASQLGEAIASVARISPEEAA